jgi:hypothetical protein
MSWVFADDFALQTIYENAICENTIHETVLQKTSKVDAG